MATCSEIATFLQKAQARTAPDPVAPDDLALLQQLGLVRRLTSDELAQVQQEVARIQAAQAALAQASLERQAQAGEVTKDAQKTHSILFHLEGVDHQHSHLEHLQQEEGALRTLDEDLAKRQQDFAQLLVQRALLDAAVPFNGGFLAITTPGRIALRDLTARLYRVGDEAFSAYWAESARIDTELAGIADASAQLAPPLAADLPDVERSYLWAVAIGLVKTGGDPAARFSAFLSAYRAVHGLSDNVENALLAAEILALVPRPLDAALPIVESLKEEVGEIGVPSAAQLGVASILLSGERADGTFATDMLQGYLTLTPSYESAALLAIQNRPYQELSGKFTSLKSLAASWGYSASEDTELASAYLAASDLPLESVPPKLGILARGLAGYLQYPLVAAAILASIPVMEANETLNLVEKAYEILGHRTGPMSQAELITLSVRMVHGVDVRPVDAIDPAARATTTPPGFTYADVPPHVFLPVFIVHHSYYSTFSAIGGPHPGHVHAWGGGGFTG